MFISTVEKGLNSQIITENCELVNNTVQHFTNYPFQAIGRYFRPLDYCTAYTLKKGILGEMEIYFLCITVCKPKPLEIQNLTF